MCIRRGEASSADHEHQEREEQGELVKIDAAAGPHGDEMMVMPRIVARGDRAVRVQPGCRSSAALQLGE
jgi:hypothetical protein